MFCPNCGAQNDDADLFCAACGTPLREVEAPEEPEFQEYETPGQPSDGEQPWQNQPSGGEPSWQGQPSDGGQPWQGQPADGGTSWQQGYGGNAYQGQPAGAASKQTAQRKPLPKLMFVVIAEAVAAIALIIGLVMVMGKRFSPETVALNYWEASMNHEWGKAYDYCSFPDSDLLSRQMYVNANANNDEIIDYESVKVIDTVQQAQDELSDLNSLLGDYVSDETDETLNNDDMKYYVIEYRVKGSSEKSYSYLTVAKTSGKQFLFWDDWKVTSSDSWAQDVQITIPESAEMTLNGTEVDSSGAEVDDGMKTITIPYLFTGEYQMSVTEEGMMDYNRLLEVSSYGIDESYITLIPSQETVDQVAAQAGDDIKLIMESALQGKDFSEKESIPYIRAGREEFLEDETVQGSLSFFRYLENPADTGAAQESAASVWKLEWNPVTEAILSTAAETFRPLYKKKKPVKFVEEWIKEMHLEACEPMRKLLQMTVFCGSMTEFMNMLALGAEGDLKRSPNRRHMAEAVTIMTLHGSKGLEFPAVFIYGVNRGSIPLENKNHPEDPEEERRLFYVGMTRAKEELVLTTSGEPSDFLRGLDDNLIQKENAEKKKEEACHQMSLFEL